MDDFKLINIADLQQATGLNATNLLAVGQGRALKKATFESVGTFLGISASVVLGSINTTPTEPSFTFAGTGVYPLWGNSEVTSSLAVIQFDGTNYSVMPINIEVNGVVEEGNTNAVSGGTVYDALKYSQLNLSNDILPTVRLIDGFYIDHSSGQLLVGGTYYTTDFIKNEQNNIYEILKGLDNIQLAFYDVNKVFINDLKTYSVNNIHSFFNLPAEYFRISFKKTDIQSIHILFSKFEENIIDELKNQYVNLITNYTPNTYINQNNGGLTPAAGFSSSNFIRVSEGKTYRIPSGYCQYAFYDLNFKYITNTQSADGVRLNVQAPQDGYIRLSFADADLPTRYFKLISNVAPIILDRNIITVRKTGGDFNSIKKAYDFANTRGVRQYIEIDNGEWEENLEFITGSGHNFIGDSKQGCIIFNQGKLMDILKVKAGFNFENITFDQRYGGYAVHPDYGGEGLIEFLNCKFLTKYGSAIGAGSADGQTLRINRCEIHQIGSYNPTGVLYWHNSVAVNNNSKKQRLEVLFSEIYSANGTPPLRIDDANSIYGDKTGNNASIMFAHNTLYAVGTTPNNSDHNIDLRGHYAVPIVGNIVGCIKVDPQSTGNNLSKLNY